MSFDSIDVFFSLDLGDMEVNPVEASVDEYIHDGASVQYEQDLYKFAIKSKSIWDSSPQFTTSYEPDSMLENVEDIIAFTEWNYT